MGDDGGLGPLVGLINVVGGGLGLAGKGLQQLTRVPRMAGEAYSRLPPPAQRAVRMSLEYGFPVTDFVNRVKQGEDPVEAATDITAAEIGGRLVRSRFKNPYAFAAGDIVGNVLGGATTQVARELAKQAGEGSQD